MTDPRADIKENEIFELSPELLNNLLKDRTLSTDDEPVNIFWATNSYAKFGCGYQYGDQIKIESITGSNGDIIVPRAIKTREQQMQRSRDMAEVFTPSWICNAQNNLIDEAWFGRTNVFNIEYVEDGVHKWKTVRERIEFPEDKTWCDYVRDTRLEITCGEAPYLVSRYDTTTGKPININDRIGMLDRKLRVISENTETPEEWLRWTQTAYQNIYGYEWQGDNLLIARESLLISFIEYYEVKFGTKPQLESLLNIAYIISWNLWQMDGLKGVIPGSCAVRTSRHESLFGDISETITPCEGCKKGNIHRHTGIYCKIRDWEENKTITFVSLIKQK